MNIVFRCLMASAFIGLPALYSPSPTFAGQPPVIKNLDLRGLQSGGTTTLTIDGSNLLPDPKLVVPFPIAGQKLKEGSTADRLLYEVSLDNSAAAGIYRLRVATKDGVSDGVSVAVDALPQIKFAAEGPALPFAMHGVCVKESIKTTTFAGKAGEKIVVEVEAQELGSALRPLVHLYDSQHVSLGWAQSDSTAPGAARLLATLPADGKYSIEVHDTLYKGAAPGHFRLKVGTYYFADLVYPLAVQKGTKATLEFAGANLPAESRVEADFTNAIADGAAPWPTGFLMSGPAPRVRASELVEHLEQYPPAGELQTIDAPAAINGRLLNPGAVDRYRINVTPGAKLQFDMLANAAGSPLDGVLSILDEAGKQLATSDDRPGTTDPGMEFTVPAETKSLVIAVTDLQKRGGPEFIYRVSVSPPPKPDFSLTVLEQTFLAPKDGVGIARVRATRQGYNGPIRVSIENLPEGISADAGEIPPRATDAIITLRGRGEATHSLATIVGESTGDGAPIRRAALLAESQDTAMQPWLRRDIAFAVTPPAPLAIQFVDSSSQRLLLSMTDTFKVALTRNEGANAPVRLSFVASQAPITKNIPTRDIFNPLKPDKIVENPERMLRIKEPLMVPAEQNEAALQVIVPGDLPLHPFDVAVKAELLAADGKSVVATVYTPPTRITPKAPFRIELANAEVEAKAGAGETGIVTGRVHRSDGFNQPVSISLVGLPKDLPAPIVDVSADTEEFKFPVSLPYGAPEGEMKGIQVFAQYRQSPSVVINSNGVPIAFKVVPGDPPPALYRVFEDESHFVNLLSEGKGRVELFKHDRYSGDYALKVFPEQRLRTNAPGLGVKISEKPGPGEYRFLRFAWKKSGGTKIRFELAANGKFGPNNAFAKGPYYRYQAGPPPNRFPAIEVSETLPTEWTVVTRDLFTDFGAFQLDGLALTTVDGDFALFDNIYLARSMSDFDSAPAASQGNPPLAIFDDQADFSSSLTQGEGVATLDTEVKLTGAASLKVTPNHRSNPTLPGLKARIRENPGEGEYRFLTFAWKKTGGQAVGIQIGHDGRFGADTFFSKPFRYDASSSPEPIFGGAERIAPNAPEKFAVITRDLFADFGEFELTGIGLAAVDGEEAHFDRIYLGRSIPDFNQIGAAEPAPAASKSE